MPHPGDGRQPVTPRGRLRETAPGSALKPASGRVGASALPARPVGHDELAAFSRAIPDFIHALKTSGGPPAPALRDRLAACTLGPRHINVLHIVALEGAMSVSSLASRLDVALPTASLMVGELSRSGLLERTEDPEDRRRTIVTVAPELEGAVRDFVERRFEPLRRALDRLTPGERRALLHGLHTLSEEWSAAASPAGGERCAEEPPPLPGHGAPV